MVVFVNLSSCLQVACQGYSVHSLLAGQGCIDLDSGMAELDAQGVNR
jgi:hypothetical protein